MRYDVEVSGFGSHASGHLNLLRLRDQISPGGDSKEHWPTLGLNTLRWAKRQGAVCGNSDSNAAFPKSQPCAPPDVHATIFNALGIDPRAKLRDMLNRPFPSSDGDVLLLS